MVTKERIETVKALTDVSERVQKMAEIATELNGHAEIVGKWVWASWDERPSLETRELLKAAKFRWNATRRIWQYAGVPRRRSNASNERLRAYYQARRVAGTSTENTPRAPMGPIRETVHSGEEI